MSRYKELYDKYRITRNGNSMDDFSNYDVVVGSIGYGYANHRYKVYKNDPDLSSHDLALICDRGNLCFGYREEGNVIVVYTD